MKERTKQKLQEAIYALNELFECIDDDCIIMKDDDAGILSDAHQVLCSLNKGD